MTEVLAHDVARRWLLMADAGEPLRTLGNPPQRWLEFLPTYGELQIGEAARTDEHLARGVPDLRTERLPALFEELLRAELLLGVAERSDLEALLPRFSAMCDELEGAGIDPTVQHDDLHMNNVYVKDGMLRVLDWGDASIGHPFFSLLETFRFLAELNGLPPDDRWFTTLRTPIWSRGDQVIVQRSISLFGSAASRMRSHGSISGTRCRPRIDPDSMRDSPTSSYSPCIEPSTPPTRDRGPDDDVTICSTSNILWVVERPASRSFPHKEGRVAQRESACFTRTGA